MLAPVMQQVVQTYVKVILMEKFIVMTKQLIHV
jgi:hypothetical protein